MNLTNNMVCDLVFEQCGWFGANRYKVVGTLFGSDDAPLCSLEGKWQQSLRYWCDPCRPAVGRKACRDLFEDARAQSTSWRRSAHVNNAHAFVLSPMVEQQLTCVPGFYFSCPFARRSKCDGEGNVPAEPAWIDLWEATPRPAEDPYGFTNFAHKLNSFELAPKALLASDSRLRPDRQALEAGEMGKAGSAKHELEEQQRAERRTREEKGDGWVPRWFQIANDADNNEEIDTDVWAFTGAYGDRRKTAAPVDVAALGFSPWQYAS